MGSQYFVVVNSQYLSTAYCLPLQKKATGVRVFTRETDGCRTDVDNQYYCLLGNYFSTEQNTLRIAP